MGEKHLFYKKRISQRKIREILRCFVVDCTAKQTSELTNSNRNTINRYYKLFRKAMCKYQEEISGSMGEVDLDESYFEGKKEDKKGRGLSNKIPVFGILRRNGEIYTKVIKNASSSEIKPIIKKLMSKKNTLYSDKWKTYDGLLLDGYKHCRINHSKTFVEKRNHINGIENFWGWCKIRLVKMKGIKKENFYVHLKECEFRFNHRALTTKQLYNKLIMVLKSYHRKVN